MRASAAEAGGAPLRTSPFARLAVRAAKVLAVVVVVAAPWVPSGAFRVSVASARADDASVAAELRRRLAAEADSELRAFYAARGWRPLWVDADAPKPAAEAVVHLVDAARRDGFDPDRYGEDLQQAVAAAHHGDPAALARAELVLSRAFTAYLADLRTTPDAARPAFIDRALAAAPPTDARAILHAASMAPSLTRHVQTAGRMNPVYEHLREALAVQRTNNPTPGDDATERLILANMDRVRGFPRDLGRRFVLVDAAAMRLDLYEDGRVVDSMPVVVGRRDAPTPEMAGLIRYARFNPYWNLPETMVRDEIAPRVLREGPGFLAAQRMQILSDWSAEAKVLEPAQVDWSAVAAGATPLRVRQLPGAGNFLGQVKLMLPNELGVYLHDTPHKAAFAGGARRLSAGCVRLADAGRLARRLLDWDPGASTPPGLNQRVDLPKPVPVYITYLTADLEDGHVVSRPDVYGRDARLLAARESPTG